MIFKLKNFFKNSDESLILLFGSYANNKEHNLSDVDIGVFFKESVDLKKLGYLNATLEARLNKKIDIVVLNEIEKKDPLFAFNILENHIVLHQEDEAIYINFKTAVQLSYLDHKYLIDQGMRDIQRRINSNSFAERNYA